LESEDLIAEALKGADLLFIAAGFGAGVLATEKAGVWKGAADLDIPAFLRYGGSDSPSLSLP